MQLLAVEWIGWRPVEGRASQLCVINVGLFWWLCLKTIFSLKSFLTWNRIKQFYLWLYPKQPFETHISFLHLKLIHLYLNVILPQTFIDQHLPQPLRVSRSKKGEIWINEHTSVIESQTFFFLLKYDHNKEHLFASEPMMPTWVLDPVISPPAFVSVKHFPAHPALWGIHF